MKFEVLNFQGQVMAVCKDKKYVPDVKVMDSMHDNGYKFRLDGKIISLKQAKAFKKER